MTDLDDRIREAITEVAEAYEPASSEGDLLGRLRRRPPVRPSTGNRTATIAAVLLVVVAIGAAVLVRVGAFDDDSQPVRSGPAPTDPSSVPPPAPRVSPTVPPGVIPSGWHDWGTPPGIVGASAVQIAPVGSEIAVVGWPNDPTLGGPDQRRLIASMLDLRSGEWRSVADPPLAAGAESVVVDATTIGDRAAFWAGQALAVLDPATDDWWSAASAPRPLEGPGVWTGTELVFVADGLRYRPDLDSWTPTADPPSSSRWSATWDGQEVIAAGLASEQVPSVAHAFAYDPATDRWRRLSDPPIDGQALDITWDGRRVVGIDYVMGAATYEPATDVWTRLPALPLDPFECGASVRPMGDTVLAQLCGGDAVLGADGQWRVVTDGSRGSLLRSIGSGVATFGVIPTGLPHDGNAVEQATLWTFGP